MSTGITRAELIGRTTVELGMWPSPDDRAAIIDVVRDVGAVRYRTVRIRRATAASASFA